MALEVQTIIVDRDGNRATVNADGSQNVTVVDMPAITVDPPVGGATEAKQDAGNALLTTIDADTSALAGAVAGGKVQAEVTNTPNVAVTSLPTATVQATDLDIRNLVAATDAVTANVPTGGGQTPLHAVVDIAAATTTQVVAAAGGSLKCKVLSWFLFSAGTNTVTLKRGTTKLAGDFAMTVGMPLGMSGSILAPVFATAANEALNITTSTATQLSGHITYILEA